MSSFFAFDNRFLMTTLRNSEIQQIVNNKTEDAEKKLINMYKKSNDYATKKIFLGKNFFISSFCITSLNFKTNSEKQKRRRFLWQNKVIETSTRLFPT